MTLDNLLANVFSEAHSVTDPGSAERCAGRRACLSVPESLCLGVSMLGVSLLSRTRTAHSQILVLAAPSHSGYYLVNVLIV